MTRRVLPGNDPLALTYHGVRAAAQRAANELRMDHGIERVALPWPSSGWRFFLLPRRENRYGHELRCEVVMPERDALPGHGPGAPGRP